MPPWWAKEPEKTLMMRQPIKPTVISELISNNKGEKVNNKQLIGFLAVLCSAIIVENVYADAKIEVLQSHGIEPVNGGLQVYILGMNESNNTYSLTNKIKVRKAGGTGAESILCSSGRLSPGQSYKTACTIIGYQDSYDVEPPVITALP